MTSKHTPFTLHYIAMNSKNEISFIYKPLITQKLFSFILMYQLPVDDPFRTKPVLYKSPIYVIDDPLLSGFGGLVVSVLASATQDRRFKPSEKILSTPSFGGEVKPSVPCRRFAAR
jgi:hypothetical protein